MIRRLASLYISAGIVLTASSIINSGYMQDEERILVEDKESGLIWEQILDPIHDIDFPPDTAHTLIDIRDVDTTKFEELYEFWLRLPISSTYGTSISIGDTDKDSLIELIGYYRTTGRNGLIH